MVTGVPGEQQGAGNRPDQQQADGVHVQVPGLHTAGQGQD